MPGKRNLDGEDAPQTAAGTPSYISFSSVTQHDIWAPANTSTSKKNDPRHRISYFIYALQFNPDPPADLLGDYAYVVAVVTAEHCLFLRVSQNGDQFEQFENFSVPDQPIKDKKKKENEAKEDIYTMQWIKDPINRREWTAVAFAGSTGIIRLVDLKLQPQRVAFLRGHATAVNELAYCQAQPAFILSGSKDHTIRLWSIKYLTCLAVFGGAQGHRAEIISLDVDLFGSYVVSGSFDSTIKIWNLFNPEHTALLDSVRIHAITPDPKPVTVPSACFSVSDVHDGQIDCVRWAFGGDKNHYVISKASDKSVLIWMPTLPQHGVPGIGTEWQLCHKMKLANNDYWFVKFALWQNEGQHVLALGDDKGWIRLHDLQALATKQKGTPSSRALKTKPNRTSSPSKAVIRACSFSTDGKLLIGGSDDGICHIFRRTDSPTGKRSPAVKLAVNDGRFETDDEDELDEDFREC